MPGAARAICSCARGLEPERASARLREGKAVNVLEMQL